MLRLVLVRHGETLWNAQQKFQGHSDVPLSPAGRAQAITLAEMLQTRTLDAVYSSDLKRAMDTAEAICQGRDLSFSPTPAWRELSFGRWEGLTYEEIRQDYPNELQVWLADRLHVSPPAGESLAQLQTRVQESVRQLIELHTDQTVLVVAHGGPVQLVLATNLGLPPEAHWQFRVEPGSLSELELHPAGTILVRLNHTGSKPSWGD